MMTTSAIRRSQDGAAGTAEGKRQPWHASTPAASLSRAARLRCRVPGVVAYPFGVALLHGDNLPARNAEVDGVGKPAGKLESHADSGMGCRAQGGRQNGQDGFDLADGREMLLSMDAKRRANPG